MMCELTFASALAVIGAFSLYVGGGAALMFTLDQRFNLLPSASLVWFAFWPVIAFVTLPA